jgi:tetratricopeptide (TPR) repeat protein
MSLLLDALKKAAKDKNARSDAGENGDTMARGYADTAMQASTNDVDSTETDEEKFEFTLDEAPVEMATGQSSNAKAGNGFITNATTNASSTTAEKQTNDEKASISAMHATITDEALQLLIRKSNAEHRKRQFMIWVSVISGSVFILILAGLYFYIDMDDEIAAIQLKNRHALATLTEQTKIEDHLTSLATPPVKPVSKPDKQKRPVAAKQPVKQAEKQKQTFTVQKTEKKDPINVLLNRGWSAFQRGEYDSASKAYTEVLQREARNRDAILGIAAIAGKRGETEVARENYLKLLQIDPLDPYAHAGLASIAQTEGASLSESRLKQLIEKQPDGAHLQFVLGNLYAQQDKWPQAQQAYYSAWQGDSENADYAFNLAVSLDHLKKYKEAERFYASCLDLAHNRKTGFSVESVETRLQHLRAVKQ